jgi:tetratricopeptide (TPR) repeat protein
VSAPRRHLRLAAAAIALLALGIPAAHAEPTVWARARDSGLEERRALIAQADELILRYENFLRSQWGDDAPMIGPLWLRQARVLYEQAGAPTSRDPLLRLRYAGILEDLEDYSGAAAQLEALLRGDPPEPVQAEAWRALAVHYARLGRHEDEIKAYAEALAREPHTGPRATLLANRAEAYMALGDIVTAVAGYRAALAQLPTREVIQYGVTTLWGLSVALDRSGDLEGALAHITLARSYDRTDQRINGRGWFYVPPHDEAWYKALGHWQAARAAETTPARNEHFNQAVTAWHDYLARAPEADRWIPLARARLAQCEKERSEAFRRGLVVRSGPSGGPR